MVSSQRKEPKMSRYSREIVVLALSSRGKQEPHRIPGSVIIIRSEVAGHAYEVKQITAGKEPVYALESITGHLALMNKDQPELLGEYSLYALMVGLPVVYAKEKRTCTMPDGTVITSVADEDTVDVEGPMEELCGGWQDSKPAEKRPVASA
jgi:hypothetical protein